jgi:PST family polysaccharide transporter
MKPLIEMLRQKLRGRSFAGAMGAMILSEGVNRITRLLTAVVMARYLSVWEFGLVAVALTTTELLRVLTASGLGAGIIRATVDELEDVCVATRRLTFYLYLGVFALQLALAWPVARAFAQPEIVPLVLVLAVPLLIYPFSTVQVFRMQRARRSKVTASMLGVQLSVDNLLTVILLMSGFGVWAVVWPKIACALAWVVIYRRLEPWHADATLKPHVMAHCWKFSRKVLGSECLQALRTHADKLIIAKLLGLEAAGLYYFAFNAGVGITTGLVNAFALVLLPEICASANVQQMKDNWRRSTVMIYAVIGPLVLAQVLLAPWYVPLVFGQKWTNAVPLVMLLSAGALSLPLWRSVQQLLRAGGHAGVEFNCSLVLACISVCAVVVSAPHGLTAVAIALLFINLVLPVLFASFVLRQCTSNLKEVVS